MGAANVIPGVSGGTIAFVTGIYEDFIQSLKSFDAKAVQLLFRFRIKAFIEHVNFWFLFVLVMGIFVSLLTLGRLLDYLFVEYPIYVWSFFFGLIAISIVSVGKTVTKWSMPVIFWFLVGTALAVMLAFLNPASENDSTFYLIICGVVAIASMILPGLSGSFVLILMGNYRLIMLKGIPELQWKIIAPVAIGCIIGFILLSRVISFFMKRFHNSTISVLTGFILGSLLIIWPWKNEVFLTSNTGELILKNGEGIVSGYDWVFPAANPQTFLGILFIAIGIFIVLLIERLAKTTK